jgi:hypothetical protein
VAWCREVLEKYFNSILLIYGVVIHKQNGTRSPFNPTTTIRFSIPVRVIVTLKVYDVLGNEIATLVNEEIPAASYEVEFNGKELPSGVYFYRLNARKFSETK